MILTAKKVLLEYNAVFSYAQSDEITLLFKKDKVWQYIYNWRIFKLISLIASYTSISFNEILKEEVKKYGRKKNKNKKLYELYKSKIWKAYFDAKVFGINSIDEIAKILSCRIKDARKNYISTFVHYNVKSPKKEIFWLNNKEKIKYLKEKYNIDAEYYLVNDLFNWTLLRKIKKDVLTKNPITNENILVNRTAISYLNYLPKEIDEVKRFLVSVIWLD